MSLRQRAVATDPGRRRRRNEDAYVVQPPLFAVADGMGGAQAGEIAAGIAAMALREGPDETSEQAVAALIQEANRRVYEAASSDEAQAGMGTTVTAALLEDGFVRIGHVGDSRAYRVRDGALEQLTDDHSLVAELVRSGKLSPEEADVHPQRSVITRVLGTDPDVDVDTFTVETRTGDVFLLCSDGLSSMVDDGSILGIVSRERENLDRAARALIDAANRAGGEDNITVILFEVGEPVGEDTADLPVVGEPVEAEDDERTLTEVDRVPVADSDTLYLSRDELEAMAAESERPRRRRSGASKVFIAGGIVTTIVVLAALVVWSLSRSYFVGVQPNGHIAVYQGYPWNLVGGVRLYRIRYESPVLAGQLSESERRKLFDHDLRSYGRALASVKVFEAQVVP